MGDRSRADLSGDRIVVVGASSGIGAASARAAVEAGARVAFVARRRGRLDDLIASLDAVDRDRAMAIACDVRDPSSVAAAMAAAVEGLGGLDAVLYAVGVNHLGLLEATTSEQWRVLFETNVVGASLVTSAVLPALRSARAAGRSPRVGFLSSHSVPAPWSGLVAYAATKAALETMVQGWRVEVPEVVFARIVIGPTMTPMAEAWDPVLAAGFFDRWEREGNFVGVDPVTPEAVAIELIRWLADPSPVSDLLMPNAHPRH
jgi:NAD(P)-dependent dehydrogenase (short-subunit alcohol dehydrogenase family)